MTQSDISLRPGRIDDATLLAELVNYAGEGLPLYLWAKLASPVESAWEVGRRRAARDEGSFSYRNATIIQHGESTAGCLIGYEIPDVTEPVPPDMPAMFVPLQELENMAPSTWYVNVLAVQPISRRKGLGTALLIEAEARAKARAKKGLSVIVSDANVEARRLYQRCGFSEVADRTMVKEDWQNDGQRWLLMTKHLA
jgi:ribosomal protein S18 acetylase RimI-like enzyme